MYWVGWLICKSYLLKVESCKANEFNRLNKKNLAAKPAGKNTPYLFLCVCSTSKKDDTPYILNYPKPNISKIIYVASVGERDRTPITLLKCIENELWVLEGPYQFISFSCLHREHPRTNDCSHRFRSPLCFVGKYPWS